MGVGLQIALCCDVRIGSRVSKLVMPEFRVGIACNFGGYMLETVVGRSVMQDMLYTCAEWPADRALADRPPARSDVPRRPVGARTRAWPAYRRLHGCSRAVHPRPRQRLLRARTTAGT
ncbi:enoyl-CoA hydratase-related protein [Streptomyces sp. NPDC051776]|uniref:enoyl-CoA hydratase-related protein n=1 Tax=Streptomyces sp. NPDC051776 TaxID=3155414 RepID=UPI00342227B4